MSLLSFVLRWWPAFALAACLALLGTAVFVFEQWLGYAPCHLCWTQRWIYLRTAAVAAVGVILWLLKVSPGVRRIVLLLILAGFLWETGTALYHAGVEMKWWKGPSTCTGGGSVDINAVRNLFNGGKLREPMCDVALWSFAGVSMAGWNAVAAAILSGFSLAAVLRKPEA